ncbi:ornithine decarboxylase 1-like [Haematobia irritans]|uniref:ornithine decarboxylase 1-like n=1 Tax=Haematobia irritans TaxID=7368 RepID=UPI003F4FEEBE
MLEFEKTNFYRRKVDLRKVIAAQILQQTDHLLYVCDLNKLKEKYELWNKCLPQVKPFYAVKCNDNRRVLKTLAQLGTNFDCASKREIQQLFDLQIQPDRILFAQSCKLVPHIKYAKENGVMTSTVDTECEIYKLHKHYPESNLVIRFRCDAKDAVHILGKKFGCDAEKEAPALMALAKKLNLKVIGVSFHVGSGCNEFLVYDRAITMAKSIFKYGLELGFDMHLLDIGGGFPGSDDITFKKICDIVNVSLLRNFADMKVQVIAEPGRFFVTAAFTLICKIHGKKETQIGNETIRHYYLNAGVYNSFMNVSQEPIPIVIDYFMDKEKSLNKYPSILWGPTCDPRDKIIADIQLPDLQCEDFLIFPNMGAYTLTLASRFNGYMLEKIIYYDKLNK